MERLTTTDQPLLRITDIASRLSLCDRTVRKWIAVGLNGKKLKAMRAGDTGMWLVSEADLAEFLTDNTEAEIK